MTNGVEGKYFIKLDPWQWAGVRQSSNPHVASKMIDCKDCAHCVDLRAPNAKKDDPILTNTRSFQLSSIKKWIQDYWNKNKNQ